MTPVRKRRCFTVRSAKSLFIGIVACLAASAAAQDGDPVDIVDAAARERGDLSQVLVLGSSHLSSLPADFDRSRFDPLLGRLQDWVPGRITVEQLSGPQCDYLRAYAFAYPGTAEDYCPDPAAAREAVGLDGAGAEEAALALLAQQTRSPSETRRLAVLFLAIGEPASVHLQWLYLPEAERHADAVLTQPLADFLVRRGDRMNETEVVGVALARRLGLQRIHPVDDHTGDRAANTDDDELYAAEVQAAWQSSALEDRIWQLEAWERAVIFGELPVLDWYRNLNSDEQARLAMRTDFAAAARARQPGNGGRRYLAYWETRNLRMVANLREITEPGERVLAIVGVSHAPYYERYLAMMSDVETADLGSVLGAAD
ncbi:DUF5694 domain-containing protein [Aurantiacibacter spongiae]|uniref:TraB/GumN family protein n=1 Tax=Aurantiacibacter spongiae TaxID=2488860 RepID=A0A3N5CW14_9SPHN|nr:DUF5694 domain-containing protein [Aurantiacibacter spongiae]RPF70859.1 hypothetical protein EG799_03895 [Aurantiacibacter spongiae]